MFRDGTLKSIWQSEISLINNNFRGSVNTEVVIAGGGITGLSLALALAERGIKCIVAEARNAAFGTTGGTTAHLNTFFDSSYDEVIADFGEDNARLLAAAGREALATIKKNAEQYSISCDYEEKTGYLFARDNRQAEELDKIMSASVKCGVKMTDCSSIPFPIPCIKAAEIPEQAQFHPVKYLNGMRDIFLEKGGLFIENCRVENYESQNGKLHIGTSAGEIIADHLVYATHTPPGLNVLHFRNVPWRSYVLAVTLRESDYPHALGYDLNDPYHYYRSHIVDGQEYLIAGGEDHKSGHCKNTYEPLRNLEKHVREYFPVKEIAFNWSSQYYEPADGLPYIGRMPGAPDNVYAATGYNGNGMVFGTLAGNILSDLITGKRSLYEELFNPRRIKPVAGFKTFIAHNASVIEDLIKDRFNVHEIESVKVLKEDESTIIFYAGEKYAVYKDAAGKVHALRSNCTHADCIVHWNAAEKTWDCPCHGSRFGINGDVLNAPAVSSLKAVSLKDKEGIY